MNAVELTDLMGKMGWKKAHLARLLGYASTYSITQVKIGLAQLPDDKADWLRRYAAFQSEQRDRENRWLKNNPLPR
jgi:hypothetical protein